jgi:hypothetical protein
VIKFEHFSLLKPWQSNAWLKSLVPESASLNGSVKSFTLHDSVETREIKS